MCRQGQRNLKLGPIGWTCSVYYRKEKSQLNSINFCLRSLCPSALAIPSGLVKHAWYCKLKGNLFSSFSGVQGWRFTPLRPPSVFRGLRHPVTLPRGSRCRPTQRSGAKSLSLHTPWHRSLPRCDFLKNPTCFIQWLKITALEKKHVLPTEAHL